MPASLKGWGWGRQRKRDAKDRRKKARMKRRKGEKTKRTKEGDSPKEGKKQGGWELESKTGAKTKISPDLL